MNSDYYSNKIETNMVFLNKLKYRLKFLPYLKLLFFISGVLFIIIPFYSSWDKPICFTLSFLIFLFYVFLNLKDIAYLNKVNHYKTLNKVYANELSFINRDYTPFYNGDRFIDKNHEYSYDLDIFGEKSIFHMLNRTVTYEASEVLARKMCTIPDSKEEILLKQAALSELSDKADFRHLFIAICNGFHRNKNDYSALLNSKTNNALLISKHTKTLMQTSIIILFSTLPFAYFELMSWFVPSALFVLNLVYTMFYMKTLNKHGVEVGYLYKNLDRYSQLLRLVNNEIFDEKENNVFKVKLFGVNNSFEAMKNLSSILEKFDQRNNVFALILLNGFMLRDLFLLRSFYIWKDKYLEHIQEWINTLAEIEACVSQATYMFNQPEYTQPKIIENANTLIDASDLGHPFIPNEKCITNDFCLTKNNFFIITGANMSGKSTFLRTVGVNYILAVNGMTVCAKKFNFSLFHLFSSMRNTDDLSSGISYFNAELLRIEQLIKFCKSHAHTLIILDEILKGTNSKDKLNGSILFLKQISKIPVTGIVATHDLELAKLEDAYPEIYQNYCFEISLSDTVHYAYKIERGVSKNLNATFLLQKILSEEFD